MEKKEKKSRLAGIPAWALSILTLVALYIPFHVVDILDLEGYDTGTYELIGDIFYGTLITLACFVICRTHPKSLWYTPAICNALGILILIFNLGILEISPAWIFYVSTIVVSLAGAIVGAKIGKHKMNQAMSGF